MNDVMVVFNNINILNQKGFIMSVMQNWLDTFIMKVKKRWYQESNYNESKYDEFGELPNGITTNHVMEASEEEIKKLVKAINVDGSKYISSRTPGSRTPSDVWGLKNYGVNRYVHIMLIQVKGTISRSKPDELNDDDQTALEELANLVKNMYHQYNKPNNISDDTPLVVTYGYAGVFTEESKDEFDDPIAIATGLYYPQTHDNYIDKVFDDELEDKIDDIEDEFRILHELE